MDSEVQLMSDSFAEALGSSVVQLVRRDAHARLQPLVVRLVEYKRVKGKKASQKMLQAFEVRFARIAFMPSGEATPAQERCFCPWVLKNPDALREAQRVQAARKLDAEESICAGVSALPGVSKQWASVVSCRGRVDGVPICYDPTQSFPEVRTTWHGRATLEFKCPIPQHAARTRVATALPPVLGEEGCLSEFFRLFLGKKLVPCHDKLLADAKTRSFHLAVAARGVDSSSPLTEEELAAWQTATEDLGFAPGKRVSNLFELIRLTAGLEKFLDVVRSIGYMSAREAAVRWSTLFYQYAGLGLKPELILGFQKKRSDAAKAAALGAVVTEEDEDGRSTSLQNKSFVLSIMCSINGGLI